MTNTPTMTAPAIVLGVPGIGDSGDAHRQMTVERAHQGARRVRPADRIYPVPSRWVADRVSPPRAQLVDRSVVAASST